MRFRSLTLHRALRNSRISTLRLYVSNALLSVPVLLGLGLRIYTVGDKSSLPCNAWQYYMLGYTRKLNHINILNLMKTARKYCKRLHWTTSEKCNWKIDNSGFQLGRPFLFVTACRGKIIRFCLLLRTGNISRRIHAIRSRVATQLRFLHLFPQTK